MIDRLKTLFRTAFTHLSWGKRKLLQLALVLVVGGLLFQGWALAQGSAESDWSLSALRSGGGCVLGFAVGAFLRLFLKLGLLLAVAAAALMFGLSWLGWIELPWSSIGETSAALGDLVARQTESLRGFLSGYLPASALTGIGVLSGATQSPRLDDDDD